MPRGRHAAPTRSRTRPGRLAAVVLAVLVLVGSAGTWAYWSDSVTVTGGTLASGSMDLRINGGAVGTGTDITISSISTSDLTPGEYRTFNLSLANVGAPPFTWIAGAARGTTWTYVGDALLVQLFDGTAVDDATYPRVATCTGAALGPEVPVGPGGTSLTSAAQALAAGSTAPVCVRIGMSATADNANQGASGTIQLTFDAAQVTQ